MTYIVQYNCETKKEEIIKSHYGWTMFQAQMEANCERGSYTLGYFYQPDFHVFHNIGVDKCDIVQWYCVSPKEWG